MSRFKEKIRSLIGGHMREMKIDLMQAQRDLAAFNTVLDSDEFYTLFGSAEFIALTARFMAKLVKQELPEINFTMRYCGCHPVLVIPPDTNSDKMLFLRAYVNSVLKLASFVMANFVNSALQHNLGKRVSLRMPEDFTSITGLEPPSSPSKPPSSPTETL